MADPSAMTLIDQATEFFSVLDSAPAAGAPIARYPLELMVTTPEERFTVEFRAGLPGPVQEETNDTESGFWTLELRGDRHVFEGIFAGALTMGEAMYAAMLAAPEEKSKHNLSCAIGQTIRLAQDVHRRAKDPRGPGA